MSEYFYNIEYVDKNSAPLVGFISDGKYHVPFSFKKGNNNIKKRLLVILHGHGANKDFAKYDSEDWDVLCPLDKYGTDNYGCWWLGEKGDFFVYRLLQKLILSIKAENHIKELFFWGSSMGGYGAILHGIELQADAVYAHMPQVKLVGTDYTDGINSKYYNPIFNENSNYKSLISVIEKKQRSITPIMFLSQNVFDYPNYIQQHFFPLLNALESNNYAYHVVMNLKKGHVLYEKIFQSVQNFDRFADEISNWKTNLDIENQEKKEKKELLRFLKQALELKISLDGSSLLIKFDSLGDHFLYACYLYDGKEILNKVHYQKSTEFRFSLNKNYLNLNIKFYLMDNNTKIRVSNNYCI